MSTDESLIRSSHVTLGTNVGNVNNSIELKRWILMICADFGFSSKCPQKVSSATLQDIVSSVGAEIRGTVDKNLPEPIQPFFLEYPFTSFTDFNQEQLRDNLSELKPLRKALQILDELSHKKISANEAVTLLRACELQSKLFDTILSSIGSSATSKPSQNVQIDSILSMMDLGGTAPQPENPLVQAICSADSNSGSLTDAIDIINTIVNQTAIAAKDSDSFSSVMTSWFALKNLLKKIGRDRQVEVYIHSSTKDNSADEFATALSYLSNNNLTPDLILWNYDVTTSNASMDQLHQLSNTTDTVKSLLICTIEKNEPVLETITNSDSMRPIMQSPELIAFSRLRKESCSRTVSLCAPHYHLNSNDDYLIAGAGWLLLDMWYSSLQSSNSPFDFSTSTLEILDDKLICICFDEHITNDAAENGLTILRSRSGRILAKPRVIFAPENNECFGSVGFNLLVNRTIRLSAELISSMESNISINEAAQILQKYLYVQLEAYHVLSSEQALDVSVENDQTISINIDSDCDIDGNAIRFNFSLGYR